MSDSKKRSTKVIVHCAKSTLTRKFPDKDEVSTLVIRTQDGEVIYEDTGRTESNEMIERLAIEAGYFANWTDTVEQDFGWAVINGKLFSVREESDRKCSFLFETHNTDEDKHYERLDEVIKELAVADVAILHGECSITITTRC